MNRQNRVLPSGEIVRHPARGHFMGNRGCLHDDDGRLLRQRSSVRAWIVCETAFKGRRRSLMAPGRYTELFFLDEAVALAAGHRPCAECRRPAFVAFATAFAAASGLERVRAGDLDAALGAERRAGPSGGVDKWVRLADCPDGAMVDLPAGGFGLWFEGRLFPYDPSGYGPPIAVRADETHRLVTPPSTLAVLRAGYRPQIRWSAVN